MPTRPRGSVIAREPDHLRDPAPAPELDLAGAAPSERSRRSMVRAVRSTRRPAVLVVVVEALALLACAALLGAPERAPLTVLTIMILGGVFATIPLAVVAVAAAIQRLAMPRTAMDDEVEAHPGWRAPVAVGLFLVALGSPLFMAPGRQPMVSGGQHGYSGDTGFVRLGEADYAVLVLQQLRFVALFATVFAAWVAMSLTRRHPGWDAPPTHGPGGDRRASAGTGPSEVSG